ncbi:hypothetical protein MT356_01750 [Rathayibacter festucae]|uniref:hypothetical protein n=1 Tax=Rathayibacter festucae TaxID=110937 RepID=UPI001FB432C6|nr:hypothetical protein [Rathayibacter festucae]MCJ1698427.1 hypothetical protein [Rathayibacter festucae]
MTPRSHPTRRPPRRRGETKALRVVASVVALGVGLWALANDAEVWPEAAPAATAPAVEPTFSPAGAVYRHGYWGPIEDPTTALPIQWRDGGRSFVITTGGSGQCLNEPVLLEVLAPDRLRIETRLQSDPEGTGCRESFVLASYVIDTPAGIDPARTVEFERTSADRAGTSSLHLDPLP